MDFSSGDAVTDEEFKGLTKATRPQRDFDLMPPPAPDPSLHARGLSSSPPKQHTPLSDPPSSPSDPPSSPTNEKKDPTYSPSPDVSSSSDPEVETLLKYCIDPKYIVAGTEIDRLLNLLTCSKCEGGHISELQKKVIGTLLTVTVVCVCGNIVTRWESQPRIGQTSVGNLLSCASTVLSGQTFEDMDFFSSVFNLEYMARTQFFEFQDHYFNAAINLAYQNNLAEARREVGDNLVVVAGDGRCDSPGYNAKYCSYTMMDTSSNKILAMCLVQVSEATSSNAMEKLGFQRAMDELIDSGINVATVATDRHVGIKKAMREEYPEVLHQFDVWHISKSISKKLLGKSKRKECADLGPWVKSITNHLWWSAANCKEDEELLVEMWQSITHHVCNIHAWNSGDKYHRCAHGELQPEEERKTRWLIPDSPAHQALQDVLFDKNLVKDIRHLTKACRTGELESFHNMLLKYCPKRKHYFYPGMLARLQLAVLDHNNNTARKPAKIRKGPRRGEEQVALKYSKRSHSWVEKMIKEKKDHSYLVDIMENILKMKTGEIHVEAPSLPELPKNVARTPRPSREEVSAHKYSRY